MSVFTDAIRVLEERGWHQGTYEDEDTGAVCLEGALALAQGRPCAAYTYAHRDVDRVAMAEVGSHTVDFNDNPHTTAEDIVLLLKRAHELAEAE